MKVTQLYYTQNFAKNFKNLSPRIQKLAIKKEDIFRQNLFTPALKTHKLTGRLKKYYSFSINRQYRILFVIEDKRKITFIDIGTHSIYQ